MRLLLLILLIPFIGYSQQVDPILSRDYLDLINDSSKARPFIFDTSVRSNKTFLLLDKQYYGFAIKKINIKNGYLKVQRSFPKTLSITGNYNSIVEVKSINQLPDLQNEYVQGRAVNGMLTWRGPETNEPFSFGPAISSLEFDGNNYIYDINGRLVPLNSGNGIKANSYANNIFRTSNLFSQSYMIQARYMARGNQYLLRIKIGDSKENTVIKYNRNSAKNISNYFETTFKGFTFSSTYNAATNEFSYSNRNGFLNRVYQNALLTPISFDNTQGNYIGTLQRSYNSDADNPFFLLSQNENTFLQSHKNGNLTLERKFNKLKFRVSQSFDKVNENNKEGYAAGTAFFINGISTQRIKIDSYNTLQASATLETNYGGYDFRSTATVNYIYGDAKTSIDYKTSKYNYQRSTNDFEIGYLTTYSAYNDIELGLKLNNKFYVSNTSSKNNFFLPGLSAFLNFNKLINNSNWRLKLVSNLTQFDRELPLSTSYSQVSLTGITPEHLFQYFPIDEVESFKNVLPLHHKEWTARAEISYRYKFTLVAELFNRKISDDIFPLYNNRIELKNIADHQYKGFEFTISQKSFAKNITTDNTLSFISYNDIITKVKEGYNLTPISGFKNIQRAIVDGQSLGSIVGSRFLRNPDWKLVIGNDGYPIVAPGLSVIGDAIPDFVMKLNNNITWKRWSFNIDWEYRKGGDVWNGTQAVLDYYGRSKTSAQLRNITGYVYDGVREDGHPNTIQVNFYDPNSFLNENRWIRYGYSGVAEEYMQDGSYIRINNIGFNYKLSFKKYLQSISLTAYSGNIFLWKAYKGTDPGQLLLDQTNSVGLDFFNLPSVKTFGISAAIQF